MSQSPLLARLRRGDTVVSDGALGTMLIARGLQTGKCTESATLEHPDWIEEIASAYLAAGAEIIQTNTFGASPPRLAVYGLEDQTEKINTTGVRLARRAVGSRALVMASCGPTGLAAGLESTLPFEAVEKAYERQFSALFSTGVDLVLVETMCDVVEATIAIKTAKRLEASVPVLATMVFDQTPQGFRTLRGVTVAEACRRLADAGADVIGSNCSRGAAQMVEIAREFQRHSTVPLTMRPHAGIPVNRDNHLVYPETPEFMARHAAEMLDSGVQIIGGCCGTTPEHIRALRALVDQRKKR